MSKIKERILNNIQKNGFPEKKVSLPFRPVFDASKQEGTKLSDTLSDLEKENIFHTMKEDKIIFHNGKKKEEQAEPKQENPFGIPDSMYKKAMEHMNNMDPEQLKDIEEKVKNMSPEERENLMKMAQNFMKQ